MTTAASRPESHSTPTNEVLKLYPLPRPTKSKKQMMKLAFDRLLSADAMRVLLFVMARSEKGSFVQLKPTEMAETIGFADKHHVSRIITFLAAEGYIEKKSEGKLIYGRPLI